MKLLRSVLPVVALCVPVSAADFDTGIRAVLPPAQRAGEAAPAAAPEATVPEQAAEEPQIAEPAAPNAPAKKELSYSADEEPVKDVSPAAHPQEYARFCELLKVQAEKNLYDFCPSMEVVLSATHDPFAAEAWMKKASEEGYAAAQQYMADLRLVNVRMDALQSAEVKAAYALARRAADAGYEPAMVNVYMCLRSGVGVAKDEKAAEVYMLRACKDGGFIPRFKWLQISGRLNTYADRERAEVKAELERGNHHVAYYIAQMAESTEDRFEWLRTAAEKGSSEALFALSAMVSAQDPKTSFELLKESIKSHCSEGMFTLATALIEADPDAEIMRVAGLDHDDAAGRHLMKLAGMLGNVNACYWLGLVSRDGVFGVRRDEVRSYAWFAKGAAAGSPACSAAQGVLLLTGQGTQADPKQGLMLLNAAANAGSPKAVVALAYALYTGTGAEKNARKAADILQEAAAMGNPVAYVYLAYITAEGGENMPADARRADHYVDLAALDMKEEAAKLYAKLREEGWVLEP